MATHTSKSCITEIKYSFTKCETILNTQQDICHLATSPNICYNIYCVNSSCTICINGNILNRNISLGNELFIIMKKKLNSLSFIRFHFIYLLFVFSLVYLSLIIQLLLKMCFPYIINTLQLYITDLRRG